MSNETRGGRCTSHTGYRLVGYSKFYLLRYFNLFQPGRVHYSRDNMGVDGHALESRRGSLTLGEVTGKYYMCTGSTTVHNSTPAPYIVRSLVSDHVLFY